MQKLIRFCLLSCPRAFILWALCANAVTINASESIAHRGYSGMYVENSLPAITNAWAAGASIVEVDVRMTADGILILHHDAERGDQRVSNMSYSRLSSLLPRVITLREALRHTSADRRLLLDLKEDSAAFLSAIKTCLGETSDASPRLLFQGRSPAVLSEIARLIPGAKRYLVTSLDRQGVTQQAPSASLLAATLLRQNIDGISAKGRKFINRRFVSEFQERGLSFFVWTINPPDRIAHYAEMGVDGIISDWPNHVEQILRHGDGDGK
jgi:glycerophosphoryl diester phosphodiesterase